MNTASQIRQEIAEIECAYRRCVWDKSAQAEIIARHYAAHATLALELLKLIELRQHGEESVNRAIDFIVEEIKRNHRYDFGIELEWQKDDTQLGKLI